MQGRPWGRLGDQDYTLAYGRTSDNSKEEAAPEYSGACCQVFVPFCPWWEMGEERMTGMQIALLICWIMLTAFPSTVWSVDGIDEAGCLMVWAASTTCSLGQSCGQTKQCCVLIGCFQWCVSQLLERPAPANALHGIWESHKKGQRLWRLVLTVVNPQHPYLGASVH